jgi:hypothetical protein
MADIEHPDIIPDDDPRTVSEISGQQTPSIVLKSVPKAGPTPPRMGRGRPRASGNTTDESPKKVKASQKPAPDHDPGVIEQGFGELYTEIGVFWGMFDPICGGTLVQNAPRMAKSLEKMAENNPAVRRLLLKALSTSALGEVVAAHLPMAITVYKHHVAAKRAPAEPVEEESSAA